MTGNILSLWQVSSYHTLGSAALQKHHEVPRLSLLSIGGSIAGQRRESDGEHSHSLSENGNRVEHGDADYVPPTTSIRVRDLRW